MSQERKTTMPETTGFERAAEEKPLSLPRQFLLFLRENKKWWLLPIVLMLGMISLLALFAGGGAAPFIYTIF
jgi:hypothetical protein